MANGKMVSSFSRAIQSMNVPTSVRREPEVSLNKPEEIKTVEKDIDQPVMDAEKRNTTVNKRSESKGKAPDKEDDIKNLSHSSQKKEENEPVPEKSNAEKEERFITGYRIQSDFITYLKVKAVQNNQSITDFFNGLLSDYIDNNTPNVADIIQENKNFKDKESFSIPITLSNREKLKDIGGKYGIKSSIFINYMLFKTIDEDKNNPLKL